MVATAAVAPGNYHAGQNFETLPADIIAKDTVRILRK